MPTYARGFNNDFLVRSHDRLALLYNDRSPQEVSSGCGYASLILALVMGAGSDVAVSCWQLSVSPVPRLEPRVLFALAPYYITAYAGFHALTSYVAPLPPPPSLQNHHLAASFLLMVDEPYAFLPSKDQKVCGRSMRERSVMCSTLRCILAAPGLPHRLQAARRCVSHCAFCQLFLMHVYVT